MGLNIKNEYVHELARRAATATGKTQTGAIEEALERLLAAYGADPQEARRARRLALVREISEYYRTDAGDPDRQIRSVEDLFDESGLPR